ncbi:MAG: hypothetical protein ND807_13485 [Vicinamibacterales bacterium]|nr:hypothetical protein [Vicinamibacterales bacterium]
MTRLLAGIALAFICGCASNPTQSSAAVPLQIPEPPPKAAIDPVPTPEPPPERPVGSTPVVRPLTPPAQPSSSPAAASSTVPATPAGPAAVPPDSMPPSPAAELKPAGTAAKTLTPVQLSEALDRTKQKLDAIDRRRLNAGKQADFDSARRFLSQAHTAAKVNNLMLAQSSVEKAEALAEGLR